MLPDSSNGGLKDDTYPFVNLVLVLTGKAYYLDLIDRGSRFASLTLSSNFRSRPNKNAYPVKTRINFDKWKRIIPKKPYQLPNYFIYLNEHRNESIL